MKGYKKAFVRLVRGKTQFLWIIDECPFCKKKHHHGAGLFTNNPVNFLGRRVPHCTGKHADGWGEYILTLRSCAI